MADTAATVSKTVDTSLRKILLRLCKPFHCSRLHSARIAGDNELRDQAVPVTDPESAVVGQGISTSFSGPCPLIALLRSDEGYALKAVTAAASRNGHRYA